MLITDALLGEHAIFYLLFQDIEQALSQETLAALGDQWAVRRGPDGAWSAL